MGGMNNLAAIGLNMAMTQEAQRKRQREERKARKQKIAELDRKTAQAQADELDSLAARVAAARARAGASGTGATGGAIDALVRGLERDSEQQISGLIGERNRQVARLSQSSQKSKQGGLLGLASVLPGFPSSSSGMRKRSLLD